MVIAHFGGKKICNNIKDIEQELQFRTQKGVNEFILYYEEESFPYLVILANKDSAYLHYFKEEDDPGFRSIGNENEKGESIFYTNTDKEEVVIENMSIVNFSLAVMAAKEFYETKERPKCVKWDEL